MLPVILGACFRTVGATRSGGLGSCAGTYESISIRVQNRQKRPKRGVGPFTLHRLRLLWVQVFGLWGVGGGAT